MIWPKTFQQSKRLDPKSFLVHWDEHNFNIVLQRCRDYSDNARKARHATLHLIDDTYANVDCGAVLYYMLRALYYQQTSDERFLHVTDTHNGIGFTKFDARFLTSVVESAYPDGSMSPGQVFHVAKALKKYRKQILVLASPVVKPAEQLELDIKINVPINKAHIV